MFLEKIRLGKVREEKRANSKVYVVKEIISGAHKQD